MPTFPLLDDLLYFIRERWAIHQRRLQGVSAPWTQDVVLQTYRFCNVFREHDRVTQWVHSSAWLGARTQERDLWFAAYVARVFNRPATLAALGWPLLWTATRRARYARTCAELDKVFNAAYIVSTNGVKMDKVEYYLRVFDQLWAVRTQLRPRNDEDLRTFFQRLNAQNAVGTFMGAQVVADVKWYQPLRQAQDWWTFAASGPGSRRGLNRICGRPVDAPWREQEWHAALLELRSTANQRLRGEVPQLDAQNMQNCLCEVDKMMRVKNGEGRPKQLFKMNKEPYVLSKNQ